MAKENKPRAAANRSNKPEYVKAEPVAADQVNPDTKKVELTPEEKKKQYKESLIRTGIATVIGIICGVILYSMGSTPEEAMGPWFLVFIVIITLTYYLQRRALYPILRLDVSALDWKSWFGIEFLVIAYTLVTWTILLNTNII